MAGRYLGTLALIAYPLGYLTLLIQLWRELTYDYTTALYAVSLIPIPVVVAKSLAVLSTTLSALVGVFAFSVQTLVAYYFVSEFRETLEKELSDMRPFVRSIILGKRAAVIWLILGLLFAIALP